MKKSIIIISILALTFSIFAQNLETGAKQSSQNNLNLKYVPISKALFDKINADMEKQDDWIPIKIGGYTKKELVAFYIQSYNDNILSTWADFAYKKMKRFNMIEENSTQNKQFQKIMELPRNAENSFRFMMIMTKEQIETVGY